MNINGISAYTNAMTQAANIKAAKNTKSDGKAVSEESTVSGFSDQAAVYEPSEEALAAAKTAETDSTATAEDDITEVVAEENRQSAATDRASVISLLNEDAETRKASLLNMVREALGQQANTYVTSLSEEDIWKKLANGEVTVSEEARAEAEEAISEDGYWGVNQTSDRIVEFAKALAGDDVSKADELLEAFKEGYAKATDTWGQDLPDISQKTYDAVLEKFQEWKDSENQD